MTNEESAEAIVRGEDIDDHPLSRRTLLARKSAEENVEVVVEVTQRLHDIDSECFEYILACPTHTAYYRYNEEDLEDVFQTTGETCEKPKPVMIDWVREAVYGD